MSQLITVICSNCNKKYKTSLKRLNYSRKKEWKNYCCVECANVGKRKGKVLYCSNPACGNTFYRRKTDIKKFNYCSNQCQRSHQSPKDDFYLNLVKKFVKENSRLPVKREFNKQHSTIIKKFGSWNKFIKKAGFKPNPVLFANKHIAKDGHICDSLAEKIIDDWLYERKISHKINVPYPINSKLTADFVVGEYFIEYFGLKGEHEGYDKLLSRKLNISKQSKLKLISIFPKHLFPKNKLSEILSPILK